MVLLLSACVQDPTAPPGPTGPGPQPDTGQGSLPHSAEPWPDDGVDWRPGVTLVYGGEVLADGDEVRVRTAPARVDRPLLLELVLTQRGEEALELSGDPSAWLEGEGFAIAGTPPARLEPGESVALSLEVNPALATAATTWTSTLTVPAEGGPAVELVAEVPRPLRAVVAGDGPTLLVSDDDGATWQAVETPAIEHAVHTVTWGEGRFLLGLQEGFAWGGAGSYRWSEDGLTWTPSAVAPEFWPSDCAWGLDRFACVRSDTLSWSETGETVLHEATSWNDMLSSITFAGDRFVAVGRGGRRVVSFDGTTWDLETRFSGTDELSAVAVDDAGVLVAVGGWFGNRYVATRSTDGGLTWTDQSWCPGAYARLESLAWGGGWWLAGGASNECDGVWRSADGLAWEPAHPDDLRILGFVNGWFIAARNPWGGIADLRRSRDGLAWEVVHQAPAGVTLRDLAVEDR